MLLALTVCCSTTHLVPLPLGASGGNPSYWPCDHLYRQSFFTECIHGSVFTVAGLIVITHREQGEQQINTPARLLRLPVLWPVWPWVGAQECPMGRDWPIGV